MTKLSKAEEVILRRMGEGEIVDYIALPIDRFVWRDGSVPSPRRASIDTLHAFEVIEPLPREWWGWSHAITPAGRAYLEGLERSKR